LRIAAIFAAARSIAGVLDVEPDNTHFDQALGNGDRVLDLIAVAGLDVGVDSDVDGRRNARDHVEHLSSIDELAVRVAKNRCHRGARRPDRDRSLASDQSSGRNVERIGKHHDRSLAMPREELRCKFRLTTVGKSHTFRPLDKGA
jgi:hypothetical protein